MALIDRLNDIKIIERHASNTDKRANIIRLTELGRRELTAISREVIAHDVRVAQNLTKHEIAMLRQLLRKF